MSAFVQPDLRLGLAWGVFAKSPGQGTGPTMGPESPCFLEAACPQAALSWIFKTRSQAADPSWQTNQEASHGPVQDNRLGSEPPGPSEVAQGPEGATTSCFRNQALLCVEEPRDPNFSQ
jgi:hypothetical protein